MRRRVRNTLRGRLRIVAAILVVGDEPARREMLADLLIGWQISTSPSREAVQSIRSTLPDLLVFDWSISDMTADKLIESALEVHPDVRALGICRPGEKRHLIAEANPVFLDDLGRLRTVVARLLQFSTSH
jgi:DNA-binding NtrC family response regulator